MIGITTTRAELDMGSAVLCPAGRRYAFPDALLETQFPAPKPIVESPDVAQSSEQQDEEKTTKPGKTVLG